MVNLDPTAAIGMAIGVFRTFMWGIIIIFCGCVFLFMQRYRYMIERNIKTGAGIMIKNVPARKVTENGVTFLKTMGKKNKNYKYPQNTAAIYKKGFRFFYRVYEPDETNYFPIVLNPKGNELHPVDEKIIHFHALNQKKINEMESRARENWEKYGPILGLAGVAMVFVIAMFLVNETMQGTIETAKASTSMAQHAIEQCSGGIIDTGGAPP